MTDLIENTVLDSIQPETKAKKSRAAEKAEYETDIHHSPAFADSHFINKGSEAQWNGKSS